jgi:hypothetical protein
MKKMNSHELVFYNPWPVRVGVCGRTKGSPCLNSSFFAFFALAVVIPGGKRGGSGSDFVKSGSDFLKPELGFSKPEPDFSKPELGFSKPELGF